MPRKSALVFFALSVLVVLLLAGGCTKRVPAPPSGKPSPATQKPYTILGKTYHPLKSAEGYSQKGLASWYGPNFHGRKTANGETYDMEAMTAAHKTLPINTWVKVTNLSNGKEATVRVNDRGPFVDGRVIDLSKAAARKVGVLGPGTARVRLVALGFKQKGTGTKTKPAVYEQPASYRKGVFTVQVGAFTIESNAWRLAAKLRTRYSQVAVTKFDRGDLVFHRVRVGKVENIEQAEQMQAKLRAEGFKQAFAVAW